DVLEARCSKGATLDGMRGYLTLTALRRVPRRLHNFTSRSILRTASGEMPTNSTPTPTPGKQYRTSQRVFISAPLSASRNRRLSTEPSANLVAVLKNIP